MNLDFERTRDYLDNFQFQDVFIEELGWEQPSNTKQNSLNIDDKIYYYQRIAEAAKVAIFEVTSETGEIPEGKIRQAIHQEIEQRVAENLLIFLDADKTRSLWYWVKRNGNKRFVREHLYVKGQPGNLFLSKLGSLVIDIIEFETESIYVVEIAQKLQRGFDVERVTKKFYQEFQNQHSDFLKFIQGIDNLSDRRWYTSVLLNRLMFVYFLQRKGFIDGKNLDYLQEKLTVSQERGENQYYRFLQSLFFDGFAQLESERDEATKELIGEVKYLNGGLFLKHPIEEKYDNIFIADTAFIQVLDLFSRYSWNLNDTPEGKDDEINPDVLGYIFEKYINQKEFGAYYTCTEITEYLCDRTINKLILDRVNNLANTRFREINELLIKLDANLCHYLVEDILPNLTLLDPACGSGAFLMAAMKSLISIYTAVIDTIKLNGDRRLKKWLKQKESSHPSLVYFVKKRIITDNLFGVDIMEEATEIAKLRLFLALVSSAQSEAELEPLPNIDFNIIVGNSLIGLIRVNEESFENIEEWKQGNLLQKLVAVDYRQILKDKNESIRMYKDHAFQSGEIEGMEPNIRLLNEENFENVGKGNLLQKLVAVDYLKILKDKNEIIRIYKERAFQSGEIEGKDQNIRFLNLKQHIQKLRRESYGKLNQLLLDEFSGLGIKYEEAQLKGKAKKRLLKMEDIVRLKPFHWGYDFDKVISEKGGFDAIITNPPWKTFKPQAKEFFAQYSDLVTKNKMDIKTFEKQKKKMLQDKEIANVWLEYKSQFPYVSLYYRNAEKYQNQISIVNGRKQGTDINFYKLFVEQCFNLLRSNGECGIVIPSGIYTDLGSKQLREMLFTQTSVSGLFCFENRKTIFEGVDSRFKFVVLTFEKDGETREFPAKFMRHDVGELESFPDGETLNISVDLIRRLSPDSISVMEFKNDVDIAIAEKMAQFPLLGEEINGKWNLKLTREFDMTNDSQLFKTEPGKGRLPLYEGKMIHQFTHKWGEPRYWINEKEGREKLLKQGEKDESQLLNYQRYRLVYRAIARNTDSRTLITSVTPKNVFAGNSLNISVSNNYQYLIVMCSLLNSFCVDFALRKQVSANLNMFYIYQLPVPRLTETDPYFNEIVKRAAKLICTTPEFDRLAQEAGLTSHKKGITDETKRTKLRAELDGIIAHLYQLTETEFTHILNTFPLVSDRVKEATLKAYQDLEKG